MATARSATRNATRSSNGAAEAPSHPLATAKPLADRVIVRRDPKLVKQGNILLPDTAAAKRLTATVVSVGPGRIGADGQRVPVEVAPGQRVLLANYSGLSGHEIGAGRAAEDEEYLILREDDVLAVLSS